VLLVVDPELIVLGLGAPRSDEARLLTLFAVTQAGVHLAEAEWLRLTAVDLGTFDAPDNLARAKARWAYLTATNPRAANPEWEFVGYEPQLLEVQRLVGRDHFWRLDAENVRADLEALISRSVSNRKVRLMRERLESGGEDADALEAVAFAVGASLVLVLEDTRRFPRARSLDGHTVRRMTLSRFQAEILKFPLAEIRPYERYQARRA
jgi:hypothetical protein